MLMGGVVIHLRGVNNHSSHYANERGWFAHFPHNMYMKKIGVSIRAETGVHLNFHAAFCVDFVCILRVCSEHRYRHKETLGLAMR